MFQSSTLYIWLRQPLRPEGVRVSPSLLPEAQLAPPSKERSSQTSSPAAPSSIDAQPMTSLSERWSPMVREWTVVLTGTRSPVAYCGSRASQYVSQSAVPAASAGADDSAGEQGEQTGQDGQWPEAVRTSEHLRLLGDRRWPVPDVGHPAGMAVPAPEPRNGRGPATGPGGPERPGGKGYR